MTKEKKQELLPYFAYVYSVTTNPNKYGQNTFEEWYNKAGSDQQLLNQISEIAASEDPEYNELWTRAEELYNNSIQKAERGAKLKNLKKLQSIKKKPAKKCACGCDMIEVREDGGKITSKCACNCGGGKIKSKAKGGILYDDDIVALRNWGVIDPSISNK